MYWYERRRYEVTEKIHRKWRLEFFLDDHEASISKRLKLFIKKQYGEF